MAEPEEDDDPFAGMSATSSTVRRKSEPPEADPFTDFAAPRSTRTRRALDRDDSATIQEMPGFDEEPSSESFNLGVSSLPHRKDDSLLRLELAARMPEPTEPPRASWPQPLHPTLPLSPSELAAAGASSETVKKSGPRRMAPAPAEPSVLPGPTLPESLSAFGKTEERPGDTAKRRRAFGQDKALPARTVQLMEAVRSEGASGPGPVRAPKLSPPVVGGASRAGEGGARAPVIAWLAVGLLAGIASTLIAVWLLS